MTPYYSDDSVTLYHGQAESVLAALPEASVNCVVTSPPYFGLRDYGVEGQIGLEESPAEYVEALRSVFDQVRRVLAKDGVLFLNLGDSYANPSPGGTQGKTTQRPGRTFTAVSSGGCTALPAKNLIGVPWRVAFALQEDGWILRNDIIWAKTNGMPTSVTDRFAAKHEHVFLFAKQPRYWFDIDSVRIPHAETSLRRFSVGVRPQLGHPSAVRLGARDGIPVGHEPQHGINPGDVWAVNTQPFAEAHFACMPPELAERCLLAGCKNDGLVLDPFHGSGTTGMVATRLGFRYIGIDLNADYLDLSLRTRLAQTTLIDGAAS